MWKKEATEGCRHRDHLASQVSLVETYHPHFELGTERGTWKAESACFLAGSQREMDGIEGSPLATLATLPGHRAQGTGLGSESDSRDRILAPLHSGWSVLARCVPCYVFSPASEDGNKFLPDKVF